VELKLPISVASRRDIVRLHRELRSFIDASMQSIMRHDNPVKYPPISDQLRSMAIDNQIDLRDMKACEKFLEKLLKLQETAPSIHVSFPTEPTTEILQKITSWFREEIDPRIVIQVGLQPTIAAGVIIRTPNRQFDMSLRRHLYANRQKLGEALHRVNTAL
jgi:F0F1-type ATP synthase delta subunit